MVAALAMYVSFPSAAELLLTYASSALFFLFTAGMTLSTGQMMLRNLTTVENLGKGYKTYYVAVRLGKAEHQASHSEPGRSGSYQVPSSLNTITFPRRRDLPPLLDPPLRASEYDPHLARPQAWAAGEPSTTPHAAYTKD